MELKITQVTNFRSVEDSYEFTLDDITCLVGKNESGKTAILQAMAGLNPHPATPIYFDIERDYPRRHLTEYGNRHPDVDAVVINTKWEITGAEQQAIASEFGPNALTNHQVQICRRFNSDNSEWKLSMNFQQAVKHIIDQAHLSASEKSQLQSATNTQTLREKLESIDTRTEKQNNILKKINSYPTGTISGKVRSILESGFPRFMYFSHYDRMSGQVQFEQLKQQKEDGSLESDEELRGDRLFYEFLDYAGASLDEIIGATTYESFNAKLQGASNNITDQILDYWSQNPDISVKVTVDTAKSGDRPPFNSGLIGRARIENQLHRVDVPFSEQSAGFIWFFSFLVKFAQVKGDKVPIVLLLDEPGLSLHGKAQADLLRYFEEKLAPHHQIIYTTHSPFMIPPDKLTSCRIVEDIIEVSPTTGRRTSIGTQIRADVLNTDPDAIFPLQGALGYEITQTLFVGKHTLLVEGPSDILYLKALSGALARRSREALDSQWTICPSGGIGKIRPFVSLFKGNDLNIVVLTDYAKGEKAKVEELRRSEILRAGAVLSLDQFTEKSEADVEDLFEPELFVGLINRAYDLKGKNVLTVDKLEAADTSTERLVKKAEAYFRTLPQSIPTFDHYRPSEWLIENPSFLDGDGSAVEETLRRAELVFEAVNPLLSESG